MELVASVYAVTGMGSVQYSHCSASQECQGWLVLKCIQDLHGDFSLPTTVFSFGGPLTMAGTEQMEQMLRAASRWIA